MLQLQPSESSACSRIPVGLHPVVSALASSAFNAISSSSYSVLSSRGTSVSIAMCAERPCSLQSSFRHTTRWPIYSHRKSCHPRQRTNRCRPSRAFRWSSPVGATQSARPSLCRPVRRSFANSPFVRRMSIRRVLVHPVAADRAVPSTADLRHIAGRTERTDTRSGEIAVWRYAGWLSNQFAAGIARLHIGLQQIVSRNRRTSFFKRNRPAPDVRTLDCVEVLDLRRRRPVRPVPLGVNVAAGHTVRS
jgi:hypothetical protein